MLRRYYDLFVSKVEHMLTKQNVNLFKFDGIGVGWTAYGAEKYLLFIYLFLYFYYL